MRSPRKVICQKWSERFWLILTWKFWMMRQLKLLSIWPWKMQENIKSQGLVSLTGRNESTVPRYSQWQLQKVTKPLVKQNSFTYKFEFDKNLKFAWYHLIMLFAALGWHNLDLFCKTLMEITCFNIIFNLDFCFGL